MELKNLVGPHMLDAVDFENRDLPGYEDCNCIRFRLDGIIYVAIEDPADDYRSCLGELKTMDNTTMTNVFPKTKVFGRYDDVDSDDVDSDDILKLVDEITGEVIVEVGTDHTDDYYPRFVANFNPMAMASNQK